MKITHLRLLEICCLIIVVNFLFSCQDDENITRLEGAYLGIFTVVYLNEDAYTSEVTVSFSANEYHCSSGENYIPAGGSGTYEIGKRLIVFNDENFWTANFDWGLILNGSYEYSHNGSQLTLRKRNHIDTLYEYKLKKIN